MSLSSIQQDAVRVYPRHILTNYLRGNASRLQILSPQLELSAQFVNDIWFIVCAYAGSTTIALMGQLDDNFANIESYMISLSLHAKIKGCSLVIKGLATQLQDKCKGQCDQQIVRLNQNAEAFEKLEGTVITSRDSATQLASLSRQAFGLKTAVIDALSTLKQAELKQLDFLSTNPPTYLSEVWGAVTVIHPYKNGSAKEAETQLQYFNNASQDGDLVLHVSNQIPLKDTAVMVNHIVNNCLTHNQPEVAHSFVSSVDRNLYFPLVSQDMLLYGIITHLLAEQDRDINNKPIEDRLPGSASAWDLLKPKPTPVVTQGEVVNATRDMLWGIHITKTQDARKAIAKAAEFLTVTDPVTNQCRFPMQYKILLKALLALPASVYNSSQAATSTAASAAMPADGESIAEGILDYIMTSMPDDIKLDLLNFAVKKQFFICKKISNIIELTVRQLKKKPQQLLKMARIFIRDNDITRALEVGNYLQSPYLLFGFLCSVVDVKSITLAEKTHFLQLAQKLPNDLRYLLIDYATRKNATRKDQSLLAVDLEQGFDRAALNKEIEDNCCFIATEGWMCEKIKTRLKLCNFSQNELDFILVASNHLQQPDLINIALYINKLIEEKQKDPDFSSHLDKLNKLANDLSYLSTLKRGHVATATKKYVEKLSPLAQALALDCMSGVHESFLKEVFPDREKLQSFRKEIDTHKERYRRHLVIKGNHPLMKELPSKEKQFEMLIGHYVLNWRTENCEISDEEAAELRPRVNNLFLTIDSNLIGIEVGKGFRRMVFVKDN